MIDVIIPVYKDYLTVQTCLKSLLSSKNQTPFSLVIVEDASPEAEISSYADELANTYKNVFLVRNQTNLGFVVSVNKGMKLHPERDVILLNSDTEVAFDWIDRMHRLAYSDPLIATVTPFSNNATICSFPRICHNNDLLYGWSVDSIDRVFAQANAGRSVEIPTAVGYCMYIKRSCLNQIGLFDAETFGRGYGEENDFCMRAAEKGWKHVLCADTFVFHAGNVSFGQEQEQRLRIALETLARKYPSYHSLVHEHIAMNPARGFRLNILIEIFRRSRRQKIVCFNHNRGGGTEKHIRELAQYLRSQADFIVIQPPHALNENGQVSVSFGAEADSEYMIFYLPEEYDEIVRLLKHLGISRLHFHHTMGLHPILWRLARDLGVPQDITLHDYHFINGNPTLTDEKGRFCEDLDSRDACCAKAYPIPGNVSAETWRNNQLVLFNAADRFFSPSQYAADLFCFYFPHISITIANHPDWEMDASYPVPKPKKRQSGELFRILVLGALSREKGADVLESCARISQQRGYPLVFHLLGYAYRPLDPCVHQHGPYFDAELDRLIGETDSDLIWFPALWPETYSYTLSAALRAALPIVAPDIGSFSERLHGRPLTWIQSWKQSPESWVVFFEQLRQTLSNASAETNLHWNNQSTTDRADFLYARDYIVPKVLNTALASEVDLEWILQRINRLKTHSAGSLSNKEYLLIYLLKIRQNRIVKTILDFIPYKIQKAIKRRLSSRPVHEYLLNTHQRKIR